VTRLDPGGADPDLSRPDLHHCGLRERRLGQAQASKGARHDLLLTDDTTGICVSPLSLSRARARDRHHCQRETIVGDTRARTKNVLLLPRICVAFGDRIFK
jgi:hypothetical protein